MQTYIEHSPKPIKAMLFDLDGTLADTSPSWRNAGTKWCLQHNLTDKNGFFGKLEHNLFPEERADMIKKAYKLELSEEQISGEIGMIEMQDYISTPLIKGAEEFIKQAKEKGIKIALVTQAFPSQYYPLLQHNNVLHLFDAFCDCDEVGRDKSHPDIFMLAAEKLSVQPDECLLFDDSPVALNTAKTLNILTTGILYNPQNIVKFNSICDFYIDSFDWQTQEDDAIEKANPKNKTKEILTKCLSDDFLSGKNRAGKNIQSKYFADILSRYDEQIIFLNKSLVSNHISSSEKARQTQKKAILSEERNSYLRTQELIAPYAGKLADDSDFMDFFDKLVKKTNEAMKHRIPFHEQDKHILFLLLDEACRLKIKRDTGHPIFSELEELNKQSTEFARYVPSQRAILSLPLPQEWQRYM